MKNLFLILLILWLSACSNSNSPAPEPKEMVDPFELMPLMVGATWEYSYQSTDYITTITEKIEDKKIIQYSDGSETENCKMSSIDKNYPDDSILNYKIIRDEESIEFQFGFRIYILEKSEFNKNYPPNAPAGYEFIWKKEDIEVPAGKFEQSSVLIYYFESDTLIKFYFYPGMGMIKRIYFGSEDTTIYKLKSFSIGE